MRDFGIDTRKCSFWDYSALFLRQLRRQSYANFPIVKTRKVIPGQWKAEVVVGQGRLAVGLAGTRYEPLIRFRWLNLLLLKVIVVGADVHK